MAKSSYVLCVKPSKNYIVGEKYKCVSKSGKYMEVIDLTGIAQIMLASYFMEINK